MANTDTSCIYIRLEICSAFWKIVRTFLDKRTAGKIEIFANKKKGHARLRELVAVDQLMVRTPVPASHPPHPYHRFAPSPCQEAIDYHADPASADTSGPQYEKRSSTKLTDCDGQIWSSTVHGTQITITNGSKTLYQASSSWNGAITNKVCAILPSSLLPNVARLSGIFLRESVTIRNAHTRIIKTGVIRWAVRLDSLTYMGNIWQAVLGVAHPGSETTLCSDAAFKAITGLVIGTGDKTQAGRCLRTICLSRHRGLHSHTTQRTPFLLQMTRDTAAFYHSLPRPHCRIDPVQHLLACRAAWHHH